MAMIVYVPMSSDHIAHDVSLDNRRARSAPSEMIKYTYWQFSMPLGENSALKYDELVVYNECAIIPAYLIIYDSV